MFEPDGFTQVRCPTDGCGKHLFKYQIEKQGRGRIRIRCRNCGEFHDLSVSSHSAELTMASVEKK